MQYNFGPHAHKEVKLITNRVGMQPQNSRVNVSDKSLLHRLHQNEDIRNLELSPSPNLDPKVERAEERILSKLKSF